MNSSTFLATHWKELHVECGHFSSNQKTPPNKKLKKIKIKIHQSGEKMAKKKPIDENSPLKKMMILGLYDNWLHFGNPKTLNPTVHVHQKDRTSI
jgi:hypothetical protein